MDEQRFEANLNLIQQLLECPNGEEGDIINAHRELVDADLLQVMEEKATDMAENGKSNAAEFLQNLVAHLANSIGNTVTSKEYLDFLIDVLNTTSDCRANPQVIYPILQQNLDKLTLRLAEILQDWTTSNLAEVDSEQKEFIAADIGSFGSLIRQFPQGRRAWNLEISIACYTAALEVFTRQDYPQQWAMTKHNLGMVYRNRIEGVMAANIELAIASFTEALETYTDKNYPEEWAMTKHNLGNAYGNRIKGVRATNIELAIAFYTEALEVYTSKDYPEEWAKTQNNLGNAYSERIEGFITSNIELAIACFTEALEVYTRKDCPEDWAMTKHNMGNAYSDRIEGFRAANIKEAIACYTEALEVYTCKDYPEEWAKTQNNLGSAYSDRIEEFMAANIELAIACFTEALKVYTCKDYPENWAMIKNNLGSAFRERIKGVRAENIELAIACHTEALEVYTPKAYPEDWAITKHILGSAYRKRIHGKKNDNIKLAIACYTAALEVHTRNNYPENWAMTQNNLGNAYSDKIKEVMAAALEEDNACYTADLEEVIACYTAALEVYTRKDYPEDWAMTQNNLGTAYRNRIKGKEDENIEFAIAYYKKALEVYTRNDYPEGWATTQNNLGAAYNNRIEGVKVANIKKAMAYYQSALIVFIPEAFPLDCLRSGRNLGNTAFTAGFWEIAIEGYDQAMRAVEQSRSWATSDEMRQQILAEDIEVYDKAIQACVNNKQLEKAIEYCDRSRSKHLVDLMHSNDLYANGEIPPEVEKYLREFEEKQQEIDAEVEQLRNPSEGKKGLATAGSQSRSRADFAAYTDKIEQLEAEKHQIWENIRRLDPVLAGQLQVDGMKFAAMQKLIENPYTAILCFYTTDDDTHVFVIYKDKAPQVHTCHGEGVENFQNWISKSWLSSYLRDNKSWQQGMGEFLSLLSQRLKVNELISEYLDGIEELIVIPHLFLHQIPLAALPVNPPQPPLAKGGLREAKRVLIGESDSLNPPQPPLAKGGLREEQDFSLPKGESLPSPPLSKGGPGGVLSDYFLIRYVPSCKILEYCHQRPTIKSPQYGIVENATDDLYFTPFECEEINKIVTVKEHLKGRKQATVANYRDLVKKVNVLHSSHHAKSRLDNPLASELLLGNGSITLGELMTPGWRLPELSDVFLSCCETNLGLTKITDDILTLGTGFLCAGARSVVSTLWAVDDLATSLFSIFYYQFRRQVGCSRPDALRRAQVRLRTISGTELEVTYKSQIDAILLVIVGNLNLKLVEVKAEREELKLRRKSYNKATDEFNELQEKLKDKTKEENRIGDKITRYETLKKNLYTMSNPFADLIYWSGFICQGLH